MKLTKKSIKELNEEGEDFGVREEVCGGLRCLIEESERGEIAIPDFVDRLEKILIEVKGILES
jgi:hypothetical protein